MGLQDEETARLFLEVPLEVVSHGPGRMHGVVPKVTEKGSVGWSSPAAWAA
jgi:hypothetical protein